MTYDKDPKPNKKLSKSAIKRNRLLKKRIKKKKRKVIANLIETDLKAEEIARKALKVASDICVFTNNNITSGFKL